MGAIYYIIPVTLRRRIYSPGLAEVQFWLITVGFLLMMLTLQIGGLIQGAAWLHGDTVQQGAADAEAVPDHPGHLGRADRHRGHHAGLEHLQDGDGRASACWPAAPAQAEAPA